MNLGLDALNVMIPLVRLRHVSGDKVCPCSNSERSLAEIQVADDLSVNSLLWWVRRSVHRQDAIRKPGICQAQAISPRCAGRPVHLARNCCEHRSFVVTPPSPSRWWRVTFGPMLNHPSRTEADVLPATLAEGGCAADEEQ